MFILIAIARISQSTNVPGNWFRMDDHSSTWEMVGLNAISYSGGHCNEYLSCGAYVLFPQRKIFHWNCTHYFPICGACFYVCMTCGDSTSRHLPPPMDRNISCTDGTPPNSHFPDSHLFSLSSIKSFHSIS